MLKFYIVSVILCLIVDIITSSAAKAKMKREGLTFNYHPSLAEKIHSTLPAFIPFFNILLIFTMILGFDKLYDMLVAKYCKGDKYDG
jgi:cellobiose-specific phosphotransferase system component IIC